MDSVLVGIDGSQNAQVALRWAAGLTDQLDLKLKAMWVWRYPSDALLEVGALDLPSRSEGDALGATQLRSILSDALGKDAARVEAHVARGAPVPALLYAAQADDTMIVVGTRGVSGMRGLLLGSVSRQLSERACDPVTVVPLSTAVDPVKLRTILVGVDGSPSAARGLSCAARLAGDLGAELVVASTVETNIAVDPTVATLEGDPGPRYEQRLAEIDEWCAPVRDMGVDFRTAVVAGRPHSALLSLADDAAADLIVVGSRGRKGMRKLLLGSVAASLAEHARIPVTIVPPGQDASATPPPG